MKHLITRILNALNKPQDTEETTWVMLPPEDSIYPLILTRGNYTITVEGTQDEWYDVTPIVNEDETITLTREGNIIGHINHYTTIGRH